MANIGLSLRSVARNLITNTFGNTIQVYSYASADKSYSDEGGETINDWGTAVEGKAVMNELVPQIMQSLPQFEEDMGTADIIVRDDLTIGVKDKVTINSVNYQVDSIIHTSYVKDIIVLQGVVLHKMES